ncbi:MAG: sulfite exporter TauE/SafE family protein [Deltaproteobacteria bacterium]|nr:sulfite exporter TauE/SafE family protein [Deltaproteobacteria bacterium]
MGLLATAALAGLAGSFHCVGMCGPIALGAGRGWHLGRSLAYAAAGATAGVSGRALPEGPWVGALAAAFFAWSCLRFGGFVHGAEGVPGFLLPLARRARGLGPARGLALGALAALLPCGLLWSALALAAATRSPAWGAVVVSVHYLATLPAILGTGAALRALGSRARKPASLLLLTVGLVVIGLRAGGHAHDDGTTCAPVTGGGSPLPP